MMVNNVLQNFASFDVFIIPFNVNYGNASNGLVNANSLDTLHLF